MQRRPPVVFLMGPTASGKTDAAVALSASRPLSIVSVDSAMVYRGMDIGTGKPDAATLARAPHALIDIRDPHEPYSAAEFRRDALAAIARIHAAGQIPLLVGGTGLYFRALRRGLAPLPSADPGIRARLAHEAESLGWAALHARLAGVDPQAGARIRASDPQRIQRALEVYEITGMPMSVLQRRGEEEACPYPVLAVSLEPDARDWLHQRIESRFQGMLAGGLVDEVAALRTRPGFRPDLPAMRSVGYRQVLDYLDGRCGYEEMVERAVIATRQLARRQLTWLRREPVRARVPADAPEREARLAALLDGVGAPG